MEHFEENELSAKRLIRTALEPFDFEQFVLAGSSSVVVREDFALSVMLLIHELATNAAKYGALSNSAGRVEISWAEEPTTRKVLLNWKERSGPPVTQPSRVSFSSRLLKAAFAQEGTSATLSMNLMAFVALPSSSGPKLATRPIQTAEISDQTTRHSGRPTPSVRSLIKHTSFLAGRHKC